MTRKAQKILLGVMKEMALQEMIYKTCDDFMWSKLQERLKKIINDYDTTVYTLFQYKMLSTNDFSELNHSSNDLRETARMMLDRVEYRK